MSNDARQRDTFLSIRDVLHEAVRLCSAAEQELSTVAGAENTRGSVASTALRHKEQALTRTLEAFLDNAPRELLETRIQYIRLPRQDAQTKGVHDAAARMVEINQQITEAIKDMASAVESEDLAGCLEGLQRDLETLARDTSMARVTARDV